MQRSWKTACRVFVALSALLPISEAYAQVQTPGRYTLRPLTVGQRGLRFNAQFSVLGYERRPDEYDVQLHGAIGAAYGITDDLEVGLSSQPIMAFGRGDLLGVDLTPDTEVAASYAYLRYRFLAREAIEIGGEVGFVVPWRDDFGLLFGLPIRIRAGDSFALDTGVAFTVRFADPAVPGLLFPIRPRVNVGHVYFGFDTGVYVDDFDADRVVVPFEGEVGVAFPMRGSVFDVYVHGGFPFFLIPARSDPLVEQIFVVHFGFRLYVDTRSRR